MSRGRSSKLPAYVERVPLARRKKPDTRLTVGIEIGVALLAIWTGAFVYYRSHELPYYATKLYAHLGFSEAQHILSQYHLSRRHEYPEHARQAEYWLDKAAKAKHPIAAYNLALAHIRGDLPSNITPDASHVHGLLTHAINHGVHEAMGLIHMCGHGQCFIQQRRKREQERKQREEETKAKASVAKKP